VPSRAVLRFASYHISDENRLLRGVHGHLTYFESFNHLLAFGLKSRRAARICTGNT
jgi:hypothetical protein